MHTHFDAPGAASAGSGVEWPVGQVLIDPAGQNDWEADFTVPLAASRAENAVVLRYETVRVIGSA